MPTGLPSRAGGKTTQVLTPRSFPGRNHLQFSSVQWLSRVRLFVTPRIAARQASLSITNSQLMPIESVMPSSHLILCRPHLLLPPIPPSINQPSLSCVVASLCHSGGIWVGILWLKRIWMQVLVNTCIKTTKQRERLPWSAGIMSVTTLLPNLI